MRTWRMVRSAGGSHHYVNWPGSGASIVGGWLHICLVPCSFSNPRLNVPSAAQRKSRRCPRTRACTFLNARVVRRCCAPSPAIAVCFARTGQCHARRSKSAVRPRHVAAQTHSNRAITQESFARSRFSARRWPQSIVLSGSAFRRHRPRIPAHRSNQATPQRSDRYLRFAGIA